MKATEPFIRIVCEGKVTEPNYFNGWLRHKGYKLPNPAYKAKDNSPLGVAREAKRLYREALKLKIPEGQIHVWAVFDKDGHANIPAAFDLLRDLPIGIAFSSVCFEFWVLLHYDYTSRPFRDCDEVISFIRGQYDSEYAKANDHFYRLKDKIPTAIANATRLVEEQRFETRPLWERNPYTDAHKILLSL